MLFLLSCYSKTIKGDSEERSDTNLLLSDFVEIEKIDSIWMNNNYGPHLMDNKKIEKFKLELGKMPMEGGSYKMGGISFDIYIRGKSYRFTGRTHGELIETSEDIVSKNKSKIKGKYIYFRTNGLNLDNY